MMSRICLPILVSGLLLLRFPSSALAAPPIDLARIKPGMSAQKVRELLGPPRTIARQILYGRYLEQWTYDTPAVRIEFDWRKGQEKQIQAVLPLSGP
jgi:hypothetical protein